MSLLSALRSALGSTPVVRRAGPACLDSTRAGVLVKGMVLAETAKAYLMACGDYEVWLPKSHILLLERDNPARGDTLELVISGWLYETKFGPFGDEEDFGLTFTDVHE